MNMRVGLTLVVAVVLLVVKVVQLALGTPAQ